MKHKFNICTLIVLVHVFSLLKVFLKKAPKLEISFVACLWLLIEK